MVLLKHMSVISEETLVQPSISISLHLGILRMFRRVLTVDVCFEDLHPP